MKTSHDGDFNQFEVFYDGDCPLCVREIDWLRKRTERRSAKLNINPEVQFTDIAAASFNVADYDKSFDELMAEIHGRQADGTWVIGVEVFRRLYTAAGFRWAVAPTRLFGIRHGLDLGYRFFAKYRTRLTGRCKDGKCSVGDNNKTEMKSAS